MTEEKAVTDVPAHGGPSGEIDETRGVIVVRQGDVTSDDESGKHRSDMKRSKDGKTVLIPQPSDDPKDPLNWSWLKKHTVLLSLLPGCFLTDWVITYGTTMVGEL